MTHRIGKWISAGLSLTVLIAALSGCGSPTDSSDQAATAPGGEGSLQEGFRNPNESNGDTQSGSANSAGNNGSLQSHSAAPAGSDNGTQMDPAASGGNDSSSDLSSASQSGSGETPLLSGNAGSYTDLAVRLFQESAKGKRTDVLISPLSVINALAMTANGAKGETLAQMEALFGADTSSLSEYLRGLNETLPDEEGCKLHLANSIWYRNNQGFSVQEDFLKTNKEIFRAEVYPSSFDSTAPQEINRWVSEHTDGMIPQIIDQIDEDTVMYLINALAFDALWLDPYVENQIWSDTFYLQTKSENSPTPNSDSLLETRVQMMHSRESVLLQDIDEQGQTAAMGFLKYYVGGRYALAALLPAEGTDLSDYIGSLSGERVRRVLEDASGADINATMPIFETECSVSMKDILTAMGMTDAFEPAAADLTGIGSCPDGELYIDNVLHKTYISVNSSGTKAGAATAVVIEAGSAMLEREIIDITLNRPFFYMIVDCENNIPVFIGALTMPLEICRLPLAEP
ncbi:MAG: serpin family protein [Roseburia sp.]|nr:serpin family protein [Roseburia sp.]MCM1096612.1 serpin family protein [Ruminococcus flavefaciens]